MNKNNFQYVFALVIVAVLGCSLIGAFLIGDTNLITTIVTAFVGALSALTAFFFTKHRPDKSEDEQ